MSCSPGYGKRLFAGASGVALSCCFCGSGLVSVSPGYGNCCAAFDGTGLSCAAGQFEVVVVLPSSPRVTVAEQFIGCVGTPAERPSGVCL